jgi:uncharacterized membrane protein
MGHSHHGHGTIRVPPATQRMLLLAVVPFVIATLTGLILLWPEDDALELRQGGFSAKEFKASVTNVQPGACPDVPGQENFTCSTVTVELAEGADRGESFSMEFSSGPRTRAVQEGDEVIVGSVDQAQAGRTTATTAASKYFFLDFDRRLPLVGLAVAFSLVVIALSRWRGVAALAGVLISLVVLAKFVLPAILSGSNPLAVAIVGGAVIMFLALYLAHGMNAATTTAVLGTFASLLLTGLLALIFVRITIFTGAGSEEAAFLQINQSQVNLQGLLLASIVIGTLGVLDDVTVTQASAVWELRRANPGYGVGQLYESALRIGRDHIASTVNTLVLAYAGASLPLIILFSVSNRPLDQILNTENVAEEIVRTLVGSIGLVASVPITTGLAALVVTRHARESRHEEASHDAMKKSEEDFLQPQQEREFWEDD